MIGFTELEQSLWQWSTGDLQHRPGSQFTNTGFTATLAAQQIAISMDAKGRFMDNVFVERLWRSLTYEDVYLRAYETVAQARAGIGKCIGVYNDRRCHQALNYRTPLAFFEAGRQPADMMDIADAMPTSPQAPQQPLVVSIA